MNIKEKANKIKRDIPAVYIALRKKETPWHAKLMALVTVIYALSPIDLVPDFIPILGYLDDIIILPLLIAATIKLIPNDILEKWRSESSQLMESGNPKKWYFAVPIILIWVIIILLIVKALLKNI